ncbi:MAG: hypothetical protein RL357_1799 [Pseudomonadota bacterium]
MEKFILKTMSNTPRIGQALCMLLLVLPLWGCTTLNLPGSQTGADGSGARGGEQTAQGDASGLSSSIIWSGELQPIEQIEYLGGNTVAPALPSEDLWDRIRAGFKMPELSGKRTADFEAFFAGKPDYIARMTERSQKYLYYIVQAIDERNMPMELALLPFVESAFNPEANSRAKAAGMWQFMPATGRHFNLKQNVFRDERRDVLESTEAALNYLQQLYGMFGDWHLALAAYNWGEGNVMKAIRRNKARKKGVTYADLRMPRETRSYVPQLMAFKAIVLNPEKYGIKLPAVPNHPFFDVIEIERDIDVALAAKFANISEAEFRALNPSLKQPVILSAGLPRILLPWENAALFENALSEHQGPLATWTAWRVPKTANTATLAKMVSMSEAELRAVNDIPKRRLVTAGSVLLVKRTDKLDKDVSAKLADTGQISLRNEVSYRRTVLRFTPGETVAQVAKRYRINARSLAKLNKLTTQTRLKQGDRLIAYLAVRHSDAATAKPGPSTVTVRRGDTLSAIARRHGVSLKALLRENGLSTQSLIRIGQKLKLPQ